MELKEYLESPNPNKRLQALNHIEKSHAVEYLQSLVLFVRREENPQLRAKAEALVHKLLMDKPKAENTESEANKQSKKPESELKAPRDAVRSKIQNSLKSTAETELETQQLAKGGGQEEQTASQAPKQVPMTGENRKWGRTFVRRGLMLSVGLLLVVSAVLYYQYRVGQKEAERELASAENSQNSETEAFTESITHTPEPSVFATNTESASSTSGDSDTCQESDLEAGVSMLDYVDYTNHPMWINNAFRINGGNLVTIEHHDDFNLGESDFSFTIRFRTSFVPDALQTFFDKRHFSETVQGITLYIYESELGFQMDDGLSGRNPHISVWDNYNSHIWVMDNQWHVLTLTVDRDNPEGGIFYLDGVNVFVFDPTRYQNSLDTDTPLYLGGINDRAIGSFDGEIASLVFYKCILSAEQVSSDFPVHQATISAITEIATALPTASQTAEPEPQSTRGSQTATRYCPGANSAVSVLDYMDYLNHQQWFRGAFVFHGMENIYIPHHDDFNLGTSDFSFTIQFMAEIRDSVQQQVIFQKIQTVDTVQGYALFVKNGLLGFQLGDGISANRAYPESWHDYQSDIFILDGQRHVLTVTVDRDSTSGGKFYLDGVERFTFDPTAHQSSIDFNDYLVFGGNSIVGDYGLFQGEISSLEFFKCVLTREQIGVELLNQQGTATAWAEVPTATTTATPPPTRTPFVPYSSPTPIATSRPLTVAQQTAASPLSFTHLYYSSDKTGLWQIYRANMDGSGEIQLTVEGNNQHPDVGPDGRIVFTSDRDGNLEVYMMDNDGSNLANLSNSPASDQRPVWLPEGNDWLATGTNGIIFESNREDLGNWNLYVRLFNQAEPWQWNFGNSQPCCVDYSPYPDIYADVSLYYYLEGGPGPAIGISDYGNSRGLSGTRIWFYSRESTNPAWRPDGETILMQGMDEFGYYQIYAMPLSNNIYPVQLTFGAYDNIEPAWATNEKIVFSSNRNGNFDIYSIDFGAANETLLFDNGGSEVNVEPR